MKAGVLASGQSFTRSLLTTGTNQRVELTYRPVSPGKLELTLHGSCTVWLSLGDAQALADDLLRSAADATNRRARRRRKVNYARFLEREKLEDAKRDADEANLARLHALRNEVVAQLGEHHCIACGAAGATFEPDPYDLEINNDDTPQWLCAECRRASADEI
jgi:hypothetical protein